MVEKMLRRIGQQFMALDLHLHTPASDDYQDKAATAADIVNAAITAKLDGICITDHNTADWVDSVSSAARDTALTVFPGVEISVTGGKEGSIHIVGIFSPETPAAAINDVLSIVGLTTAKRGDLHKIADGSPCDIINAIAKQGGIPILAHCNSAHGVLHDMKGTARTDIIQNQNLMAVESSKPETARFLDGTDPEYKRSLATYQSSDAHSLAAIGDRRSYFRGSEISLETLRLCFLDPQIRLCSQDSYNLLGIRSYPRIINLSVDSGFFKGQTLDLHPNQNCLIGSQGVGKSVLVELLRFALEQMSIIDEVKLDSYSKLRTQLGIGGKVTVEIQISNGNRYRITRTFDGNTNPISVNNLDTNTPYEGDLSVLFPIIAYSQTETVLISRNPNAQLELIDNFIDAHTHQQNIDKILGDLCVNDSHLSLNISADTELAHINQEIATTSELIHNIEIALQDPALTDMKHAEVIKDALDTEQNYHDSLHTQITNYEETISQNCQPVLQKDEVRQEENVANAFSVSLSTHSKLLSLFSDAKCIIAEGSACIEEILNRWLPNFNITKDKYERYLDEAGGDQKILGARRVALEEHRKDLAEEAKDLEKKVEQCKKDWDERTQLLDSLDSERVVLFELRKAKYQELTMSSDNKLKLGIVMSANTENFTDALCRIATGTRIRKTDLGCICNSISPREFVNYVFNSNATKIAEQAGIDIETANKLVEWLLGIPAQDEVLSLQHQYQLQDRPVIEFSKSDGNYYPISNISVGQKCTALLIIALSASDYPIIIDQPEESIDIASIFSDIVYKLRTSKNGRQFVLTTHNPNIAVTADADLIHILKASATEGRIESQGSIEEEAVREEVITYLEGGRQPYLMRGLKYGVIHSTDK